MQKVQITKPWRNDREMQWPQVKLQADPDLGLWELRVEPMEERVVAEN